LQNFRDMQFADAGGVQPAVALAPGGRPLLLPLVFTAALAGLALLPRAHANQNVLWSFLGAAAALALWNAALFVSARGRKLSIEVVLRKRHYIQACAQGSVLVYWGWYWPQVYASAHLLLAQLLFAYAFDMLLSWSRRDAYTLGFAPFPVIFSINLFLWFKPDWFYLQFVMVALGFAAKELIRWNKEGKRAHIFNPSSFPLAVVSLILILTHSSGLTWGQEIASTQFYPPHIYLMLFLIGLPGQFFFGVTSMTMSAVVATYLFGRLYFAATGVYFFYDSYIPISVFLGMHLLFLDPSTSPRTELGRILYGAMYGLSTVLFYRLLGMAGMPTFYDKLLPVPLLNLTIKGIDAAARSVHQWATKTTWPTWRRNLAYMTVWALVFAGLSATRALGDDHPGQWLPFWLRACQEGRAHACPYVADWTTSFCDRGSGWACNTAGMLQRDVELLRRGCGLGFRPACRNLATLTSGTGDFVTAPPTPYDYPVILRGSKGEIRERDPAALRALACREGWPDACSTPTAR